MVYILFILRLRKCLRLRCVLIIFIFLIVLTYLHLTNHVSSSYQQIDNMFKSRSNSRSKSSNVEHQQHHFSEKCNFDETESLLQYKPLRSSDDNINDSRPQPTVERLYKIFSILRSHEKKFRQTLDNLGIFRFTDLYNTLYPYANNTQRLHEIYCLFKRYITISNDDHIDISPNFIRFNGYIIGTMLAQYYQSLGFIFMIINCFKLYIP